MSDMPFSGSILSGCESGGKKEKKRKSGFTFEKSKNDNKATKHGGGGGRTIEAKIQPVDKTGTICTPVQKRETLYFRLGI